MRRALLVVALALIVLPSAKATTLVGPGLYRDELVELGQDGDPETGRPFPFGAASTLTELEGFEAPGQLLLTWADDRILMLDPKTNVFYDIDPFTGEATVLTRLQLSNPGPETTDPGGDLDGDGLSNALDPCPSHSAETQDSDGDGVGDLCDNCPDAPNPRIDEFDRPFYRTTTGGQPDADADGIGDACDCDFTEEGEICNVTDLLRMLDAFGKRVDSFDGCPNPVGKPGPCARYDLNGTGSVINISDVIQALELFGSQPEACPVCPYLRTHRCSGPLCRHTFQPTAITWDPVGGPVWNTPNELESEPRLFVGEAGFTGAHGLYTARLEGPRKFIFYPYAYLDLRAHALAFDPYPKNGSETTRKTLYGVNALGFYSVPVENFDSLVTGTSVTLPIPQRVDLGKAKSLSKLATPVDATPVVSDDPKRCASDPVDTSLDACDPNEIADAVFWVDDRCRPLTVCPLTVELCPLNDPNAADCVTWFPDTESCYNTQRGCSAYCTPFRLGGDEGCEPDSELSGFAWDGTECAPFEGCCDQADCELVFDDPNACRAAFLKPRDPEVDVFPAPPCPNFYHRPSCQPDAASEACAPVDPNAPGPPDGFFWTGTRCEDVQDFCCEGPDCDDAFFIYDPIPPLILEREEGTLEEKREIARDFASLECFRQHLRCPGICDVLTEVREGLRPDQCSPDEVFVNGFIWQFVGWPLNLVGPHRDCLKLQGCCRGPDCAEAAPADPSEPGTANTKNECLASFPLSCLGLGEDFLVLRSLFFENAGETMGRLVGTDIEGNLICVNPEFELDPDLPSVSSTLVVLPERHVARVSLVANFDVNADGQVDLDDVCEVEAAVGSGAEPCRPTPATDPVAGPCAPYPGGVCSATADLNRDVRVDETDLHLIERRVGLHCDGSSVTP